MASDADKIEQLMHVFWGAAKTLELRALAERLLRDARQARWEGHAMQCLINFQVLVLKQKPDIAANTVIIDWLKAILTDRT
jgi:hypothetical protein